MGCFAKQTQFDAGGIDSIDTPRVALPARSQSGQPLELSRAYGGSQS
jgi:hypothetical protein